MTLSIFDGLFDLNGDGELENFEKAAQYQFFSENEDKQKNDDPDYDIDNEE